MKCKLFFIFSWMKKRLIKLFPCRSKASKRNGLLLSVILLLIFFFILSTFFGLCDFIQTNNLPSIFRFDSFYNDILAEKRKNGSINPWYQMTFNYRSELINKNRIKYLLKFAKFSTDIKSSCIKRDRYLFEFLRIFDVDPYENDLTLPYNLILGSESSIGFSLCKILRNEKIMKIKDIEIIDFSNEYYQKLLNYVNITHIYICDSFREYLLSSSNDAERQIDKQNDDFISKLISWANRKNITITFFEKQMKSHQKISQIIKAKSHNFKIHQIPLYIDSEVFYDPHNFIAHTMAECIKTNNSNIHKLLNLFDINMIEANSNVSLNSIDHILSHKLTSEQIVSQKNISLNSILHYIKTEINCNLALKQVSNVSINNNNENEFLQTIVQNITQYMVKDDKPFVSIVIVGRHDGFSNGFEERTQHFFTSISQHLKNAPLANFEIVFVDYATPTENKKLSEIFQFDETLKKKIRFINVPVKSHYRLNRELNAKVSFYEYIAKNIGIRRAKGKFILTTNPDNLYNSDFFDKIQRKQFNDGILYRTNRFSCKEGIKYNINELIHILNDTPWSLNDQFELASRCPTNLKGTSFEISVSSLQKDAWPCGAGDFLMMSAKMWDAVGGFNEFPGNANVDALLLGKMMKFVPGYIRFMMRAPIVHQYHPRKNIFRPAVRNHEEMMRSYACSCECKILGKFQDNDNWGLNDETYLEDKF
ncbi:hypothetical protein TRFO_08576 [Tritrichomonas foetus]|uniref:Uncharacterized protein n=1 Tax=Tritrichomonas foetus TaxID=1144522 RepID=A0A1J4JIK7_9EUKA|nr:hypothetical protein TRFO_08576 [Tritrichomonas foetus]|eukprot:OHS99024.1 hypothetical protein TRFO_08576 [Tritrichomonas foetus]